MDSGGGAREWLIAALAVVMPDQTEQARAIVDALDVYLEEPDRGAALQDLTPNFPLELKKAYAERDAAIATAKEAVQRMQELIESLQKEKT
jgi:hypothetical protein